MQEYYELRNRYRSVTFLPDSATDTRRGSRGGSSRGGSRSLKTGLEGAAARVWPWQTNPGRIEGMLSDHYKDPWNRLDLFIILLIFVHCLLSTTAALNPSSYDESAGLTAWLELRPTRSEPRTRLVLAVTAIFAWFRCLGLMKVHPKLGPMVTITLLMFDNILQVCKTVLHPTPQRCLNFIHNALYYRPDGILHSPCIVTCSVTKADSLWPPFFDACSL